MPAIKGLCQAWEKLDLKEHRPDKISLDHLLAQNYLPEYVECSQDQLLVALTELQERASDPISLEISCDDSTYEELKYAKNNFCETMAQPSFRVKVLEPGKLPRMLDGNFHIHFDDSTNPPKIYSVSVYIKTPDPKTKRVCPMACVQDSEPAHHQH